MSTTGVAAALWGIIQMVRDTTLSARCPRQAIAIAALFSCLSRILVLAKGGDARQDEQAAAIALIKTNPLSKWA